MVQLEEYRISNSKKEALHSLNPKETHIFWHVVGLFLEGKSVINVNNILNELKDLEYLNVTVTNAINKLSMLGLLKVSNNNYVSFGDYYLTEKTIFKISKGNLNRIQHELDYEETYIYFWLLLHSNTGSTVLTKEQRKKLSSKISGPPFFKLSYLKSIEDKLTSKGFLQPLTIVEDKYKYVLYNGAGMLANYNKI